MKENILVIEDDVLLLKTYKEKLTNEGYRVDTALDGEDGLSSALKTKPDAILLDVNLPKMDGITLLKKLREDDWGKTVPVIMITNLDTNDERLKAVTKEQPSFYLLKQNYTLADVVLKIQEVLGDKNPRASPSL